jgi:hypothetical protein
MPKELPPIEWVPLPEVVSYEAQNYDISEAVAFEMLSDAIRDGQIRIKPIQAARTDNASLIGQDLIRRRGVTAQNLDQWLVEVASLAEWENTGLPEPVKARGRGGRPPKWDWDAFWIEVVLSVRDKGRPEPPSLLVNEMLQWFENTTGKQPASSEVRKRVSALCRRLDEPEKADNSDD